MSVKYVRDEVRKLIPLWLTIRHCLEGQKAIKDQGTTYLPNPSPDDTDASRARYKQYLKRAVFYGVTGRTSRGMVGLVFNKDPVPEVPPGLDLIVEDVDGAGLTIHQQAKRALGYVLGFGRTGLLVDYPNTDVPATRAQITSGEIRPTVQLYDPIDIINWRVRVIGGRRLLSLVVLKEQHIVEDDGFEVATVDQWRVLKLDESGVYNVEVWREADGELSMVSHMPRGSDGQPLREIPFTFIGSEDNDPDPDTPSLGDLAELNVAHYRNSADYEESCFITGQPTPYFAGLTKHWVDEVLKGTVHLGSRGAVPLPEGGSAGLLQAQPNSMPYEAMQHKERQMVALGAKLVESHSVQRTATEAQQESTSDASVLSTSAGNVSSAYTKALEWCGIFIGIDGSTATYELSTDFDVARMDAQERAQLIAEWQGGAISFTEMRDNLRRIGIAYLDDEKAREEIANGSDASNFVDHDDPPADDLDPDATDDD